MTGRDLRTRQRVLEILEVPKDSGTPASEGLDKEGDQHGIAYSTDAG